MTSTGMDIDEETVRIQSFLKILEEEEKVIEETNKAKLLEIKKKKEETEALLPENIRKRQLAISLDEEYDEYSKEISKLEADLKKLKDSQKKIKDEIIKIGESYMIPKMWCKYFGHNAPPSSYSFHCYRCGLNYDLF